MTDKQIIIDGVDVSGCDFLAKKDDYCSYSGVTYAYKGQCMCSDEEMCKEHPNCFYKKPLKQLKRKEQECEELKAKVKNSRCAWKSLEGTFCPEAQEQLDQLKAENEELKRQHQADKGLITSTGKQNYQLLQEYDKLKTALTEIKEIAERDKEFCIKCNGDKEIDCIDCIEGGRALLANELLQKISEVLNV